MDATKPLTEAELRETLSSRCGCGSLRLLDSGNLAQQVFHVLSGVDVAIDVSMARTVRVHDDHFGRLIGLFGHVGKMMTIVAAECSPQNYKIKLGGVERLLNGLASNRGLHTEPAAWSCLAPDDNTCSFISL